MSGLVLLWLPLLVGFTLGQNPEENANVNNPALFEGDMLLSPEQRAAALAGQDVDGLPGRGASTTGRWPAGVLVYTIDPSLLSQPRAMDAIEAGMHEWTSKTCIRFKKHTDERAYAVFLNGAGCSSWVGRRGSRPQMITLAPGCWGYGTVAHEIGHALGLYHEQSRTDRDNYVKIMWDNIDDDKKYNFNKYGRGQIDSLGVPYDYSSVMHYGGKAFSKNTKPTIVPLQAGAAIGLRKGISPLDAKQMDLMYKDYCPKEGGEQGPWAMITADDQAIVWVNGEKVQLPHNNGLWHVAQKYKLPEELYVVAVKITNRSGPGGLLASFSDGSVTSAKAGWKCIEGPPPEDWYQVDFDDSDWPAALEESRTYAVGQINPNALWIFAEWRSAKKSFCRKNFKTVSLCEENPCQNGGSCIKGAKGFTCQCPEGFNGDLCDQTDPCEENPCKNGGRCVTEANGFSCSCADGFNGELCDQKDPCKENPCMNGGQCIETDDNGFVCSCAEGFNGELCGETGPCKDEDDLCSGWKRYCDTNTYVKENCRKSCLAC